MSIKINHDITYRNGVFYTEGDVLVTRVSADVPIIRDVISKEQLPYVVVDDNVSTSGRLSTGSRVDAAAVIIKGRIESPIQFVDEVEILELSKKLNAAIGQRKVK